MTVYFAGGESDALTQSLNNIENTTGGRFNSTYCRLNLTWTGSATSADYWQAAMVDPSTQAFTNATTVYTHAEFFTPNASTNGAIVMEWLNTSGVSVFQIVRDASARYQAQFWNGATYTTIGSPLTLSNGTLYVFDFKIVCGASGSFEWYVGNTLLTTGSINDADCNNIERLRLRVGFNGGNANCGWSQIIMADVSTVGWHFHQKPPTGNGANTTWTGTFADVDEAITNDADFASSTAANDVETYTGAALSLASGIVKAVVVSLRPKVAASGPQNLQAALRIGGTNYFSPNLPGLNSGFGAAIGIWEQDPSTVAAWSAATAAAATTEFGMKSIT